MARQQIRRTGEQGAGMAMTGLVLGWAAVALGVLAILGITLFVVTHTGHAVRFAHPNTLPKLLGALPAPRRRPRPD